jgi:uncharacterized membrane protein YgcG
MIVLLFFTVVTLVVIWIIIKVSKIQSSRGNGHSNAHNPDSFNGHHSNHQHLNNYDGSGSFGGGGSSDSWSDSSGGSDGGSSSD